ncbi:hypothetical protein G7074_01630 [Pedobacter sp. HDW13]|uniref:hypothetical protein n=1 Tax=Pedobacter sp. HDW13 TaxID=2714940 RepID=UPI00140ADCA4|nr:hypothetical protein [Pedobacter sp. HDW13]QIL38091.1 hypothetical protein G7074_01630 [Pedobacter sp. HDW13]
MKLRKVIKLEDAMISGLIDKGNSRVNYYVRETLYETHHHSSNRLGISELERLNKLLAENYGKSILQEVRSYKFEDLTGSYKVGPSSATIRIASFDNDEKEVEALLIIESEELRLIKIYESYLIVQQESIYNSKCITFKLNDSLTIGEIDDNEK